jgi:hypothetical protein
MTNAEVVETEEKSFTSPDTAPRNKIYGRVLVPVEAIDPHCLYLRQSIGSVEADGQKFSIDAVIPNGSICIEAEGKKLADGDRFIVTMQSIVSAVLTLRHHKLFPPGAINAERAQRAELALDAYQGRDAGDTLADNIVDLIVDLMHLAHLNDIEPDYIAQLAADHYTAEIEEEAT